MHSQGVRYADSLDDSGTPQAAQRVRVPLPGLRQHSLPLRTRFRQPTHVTSRSVVTRRQLADDSAGGDCHSRTIISSTFWMASPNSRPSPPPSPLSAGRPRSCAKRSA